MLLYDEQPDDVARPDASRLEPGRQRRGPVDHLAVGDDVVAEHGERLVGRAAGVVLEHADPAQVRLHRRARSGDRAAVEPPRAAVVVEDVVVAGDELDRPATPRPSRANTTSLTAVASWSSQSVTRVLTTRWRCGRRGIHSGVGLAQARRGPRSARRPGSRSTPSGQ